MPRNGSGQFNLPAGNPVVPSTVISSTWANTTLSDIASGLTQSLSSDGQTVPVADLPMATFKHTNVGNANARNQYASAGQVQDSTLQWLTAVAGTDTITASIAPGPTVYTAGQAFRFLAVGTNTTGTVTLNINGLGAKAITKNGTVSLAPGDIPTGIILNVVYDGTQFQIIGPNSAASAPGNTAFAIRNKLFNPTGIINQRAYVSGTATVGANQYTLDRWRVVTAGQNILFTPSGNSNIITAPVAGVEQPIEASNMEAGLYYLTWTGTATAQVNGTPVTNGTSITLPGNTQATVRFINGTFQNPQLERGGITPFETRPVNLELLFCQRYYEAGFFALSAYQAATAGFGTTFKYSTAKRAIPTVAFFSTVYGNASGVTTFLNTATELAIGAIATATNTCTLSTGWTSSAEI